MFNSVLQALDRAIRQEKVTKGANLAKKKVKAEMLKDAKISTKANNQILKAAKWRVNTE